MRPFGGANEGEDSGDRLAFLLPDVVERKTEVPAQRVSVEALLFAQVESDALDSVVFLGASNRGGGLAGKLPGPRGYLSEGGVFGIAGFYHGSEMTLVFVVV